MLSDYVDEVIALSVVLSGLSFIFMGISVPEWFTVMIVMIVTFYFKRKE